MWWIIVVAAVALSIPFKVKFMNWWSKQRREEKNNRRGKWGEDE